MQLLQKKRQKKPNILLHIYYNKEYSSTNRVVFKQCISYEDRSHDPLRILFRQCFGHMTKMYIRIF